MCLSGKILSISIHSVEVRSAMKIKSLILLINCWVFNLSHHISRHVSFLASV